MNTLSNKIRVACKRIDEFFFRRDTDHYEFLVFFRISIGLFLLLYMLSIWNDFQMLFGKYGIIPWDIQQLIENNRLLISLPDIISFFEDYGVKEMTIINMVRSVFILFALFLTAGFLTRWSAIVLLILQIAIVTGSGLYRYGIDFFTTSSLFYLAIFPAGHYRSVDNLIFRNRKPANLTPFRRVLQLHACMVYFFSGIPKSLGVNWWNGESIWKSMHAPETSRVFTFDFSSLAEYSFLLMIMGWGIIIIESFYIVFMWIPKTRKIWLFLTISMHLGIAIFLNLYFFAVVMIIWNLSAFYFVPSYERVAVPQKSSKKKVLQTVA